MNLRYRQSNYRYSDTDTPLCIFFTEIVSRDFFDPTYCNLCDEMGPERRLNLKILQYSKLCFESMEQPEHGI